MLKSILKPLVMLFRSALMWFVLYLWLVKAVSGAGNVFAFYATMVAALTAVFVFMPIKPETALKTRLLSPLWRWIELASQWTILGVIVWYGYVGVAIAWGASCSLLAILRIRIQAEKKKALDKQAKEIMGNFMEFMKAGKFPDATMADVGLQS